MQLFRLVQARPPWGDYGSILLHGLTRSLPSVDGRPQLLRAGPYVPGATLPTPADLVLTDRAQRHLLGAGALGDIVAPATVKIVRVDWTLWDQRAQLPPILPDDGEPESYCDAPNDDELRVAIGPLWLFVAPLLNDLPAESFDCGSRPGIFRVATTRGLLADEPGRAWLEEWSEGSIRCVPYAGPREAPSP